MVYVKNAKWPEGYLDTAMLGQITESVARRGLPLSQFIPSDLAFFERHIPTLPADTACTTDLSIPADTDTNYLTLHAYFILYLIAPFTWFLPVSIVWSTLTVAAYLALVLGSYVFL